jgi:hypothetical protein
MNSPIADIPDIVGLVGVLVFLAGVNMLWLARHEMIFWVDTYLALLRRNLDAAIRSSQEKCAAAEPSPQALRRPRRRGPELLLLLSGVSMVFLGLAATSLVILNRIL